jgi:hypothetical protein
MKETNTHKEFKTSEEVKEMLPTCIYKLQTNGSSTDASMIKAFIYEGCLM